MHFCFRAFVGVLGLFTLALANLGQVVLAQERVPPARTLGFGTVESVAFSHDGRYLAVGADGGSTVQLIDTSSWRVVRVLEGHAGRVYSVAFSPDGKLLASGSEDMTIKLWDLTYFLDK